MDTLLRFFQRLSPPVPPIRIELKLCTSDIPLTTCRIRFEVTTDGRVRPVESAESKHSSNSTREVILDITLDNKPTTTLQGSSPLVVLITGGAAAAAAREQRSGARQRQRQGRGRGRRSSARAAQHGDQDPSAVDKIPKPSGEPGRPRSGGYSLCETLVDKYNWSEDDVRDLLIFLRREAPRTLNMSQCFRSQNKEAVDRICEKAMHANLWPALADYDEFWPVRSALKLILKYKSEASRRMAGRMMVARVQEGIDGIASANDGDRESA